MYEVQSAAESGPDNEKPTDLTHELDPWTLSVDAGVWAPGRGMHRRRWGGHVSEADVGDFGTLLRRLRRDRGMTQEELAERAGISVRTVSDLERGSSQTPYRGTIGELAAALQLEPADREPSSPPAAAERGHVGSR